MPVIITPKTLTKKRRSTVAAATTPALDRHAIEAQRLNLEANCLLQAGFRDAAEALSWRAWTLREMGASA